MLIISFLTVAYGRTSDSIRAAELVGQWVAGSAIPGEYVTPKERAATTTHPGDLTSGPPLYYTGRDGVHDHKHGFLHHTKPNPAFENKPEAQERALDAIAWMLRRGMSRLEDALRAMLATVDADEVTTLLTLGREALNSYEDFWRQAKWSIEFGPRQIQRGHQEHFEYGPETNFWLKFRPTLACHHTPRLGAELGGAKSWCNPHYWPSMEGESGSASGGGSGLGGPKFVLSAGSGGDWHYEHFVADQWPGVTVVTTDCFTLTEETIVDALGAKGKIIALPMCLAGEDPGYVSFVPSGPRERFTGYPAMMEKLKQQHGIDYFDLIKCNIEGYEYPLFAEIMRNPEANLRGTAQIHLEMHRMGMQDRGLDFNALVFSELLFATFMSGGYHPVSVEKWHDSTACIDVVWVNQTWWLEGELAARRGIWGRAYPEPAISSAIYPDPIKLRAAYESGGSGMHREL
jgi:hypothetical protein